MTGSRGLYGMRAGECGPKIVLLHGISTSAAVWRKVMTRLDSQFQLIALDLPGYGESVDSHANPTLDAIVDDVNRFIHSENETVHLVGSSFGGLLALAMVKHRPSLFRSLTLIGATLGKASQAESERKKWLGMRHRLADELPHADAGLPPPSSMRDRARMLTGKSPDDATIAEIATAMRRARSAGYLAVANIIAGTDAEPWLPFIAVPTLVLCGDEDDIVGLPLSVDIAGKIPNAEFGAITGAGHVPHVEQTERVSDALRSFIDRVEKREQAADATSGFAMTPLESDS